jgi:hypothetical protein
VAVVEQILMVEKLVDLVAAVLVDMLLTATMELLIRAAVAAGQVDMAAQHLAVQAVLV